MAKDDFHVIAYRILQYLYECLKAGQDPDVSLINAKKYEINDRYFNTIILQLYKYGYIEGVTEFDVVGCNYTQMKITQSVCITLSGIEYLTDNSFIEKAKRFFKETKSMVPFI